MRHKKHARTYAEPDESIELLMRHSGDPLEMGVSDPRTDEQHEVELREETRRKPIISINGRDVDEDDVARAV
jgi:hypothetical protein